MALLNAQLDYLREPARLAVYEEFLGRMAQRVWQPEPSATPVFRHALPRDVARWWRARAGLS